MLNVFLGSKIDLTQIPVGSPSRLYAVQYNPVQSQPQQSTVVIRLFDLKVKAVVFGSGKMICTGAKSQAHAILGARKAASVVRESGFPLVSFLNNIFNHILICLSNQLYS